MKKRNVLKIITLTLALASPSAFAQDDRGSDKVDLKKLEDKYWAAKDDDYGVIQNRTFSKSGKFFGSLVYGTLINDPYATSKALGGMVGYYFTEDFGIEGSYLNYDSKKNENIESLKNNGTSTDLSPNYNLIRNSLAISATYTPFYAKMAFMNKSIMYFDMGFTLGAGLTTYDQVRKPALGTNEEFISQSSPHVEFGVMQQLFITKNVAVRMDLKNTFYNQEVIQYQANFNNNRSTENKSTNDTTLTFGVTLFSN